MNLWIKSEEELPPCDGFYGVTNDKNEEFYLMAEYNGYGFVSGKSNIYPTYWCHGKDVPIKKYGKQNFDRPIPC